MTARFGMGLLGIALLALAGGATGARAEDPPARGAARGAEIELGQLLDTLAERTGMLFAWNPGDKSIRERRVRVTRDVLASGELDLQLVRSLLVANDLVLIPEGPKGKEVHWVTDARQQSVLLRLKPEPIVLSEATLPRYEGADGLFVTTHIPVGPTVELRELRTALSRLVTPMNMGSVSEVSDPRAIVVTDFAPVVCTIWRLVRQMEGSSGDVGARTTQVVTLSHANAAEAAQVLGQALAAEMVPAPVQPQQAGAPPRTLPTGGPRIVADHRTNKLLITGTPRELETVLRLVQELDVPVADRRQGPR